MSALLLKLRVLRIEHAVPARDGRTAESIAASHPHLRPLLQSESEQSEPLSPLELLQSTGLTAVCPHVAQHLGLDRG